MRMWMLVASLMQIIQHSIAAVPMAIVGYLPEWRFEGANWDTLCQTYTHLIIFSLEPSKDGHIVALDRMPRPMLLEEAREAARRHGTRILICFGGNGRSGGFGGMVRSAQARRRFVAELMELCRTHGFHGVDYNWEYPGYSFGAGYASTGVINAEYKGLASLIQETRAAFAANPSTDTVIVLFPSWSSARVLVYVWCVVRRLCLNCGPALR